MTTLFYTVEKKTQFIRNMEKCTGWKAIRVYEIANDKPKLWFEFEVMYGNPNEHEIQTWLDNNGFNDREYEFYNL